MQPMLVTAGSPIFSTGKPSEAVYVIVDGEVSITIRNGIEVARLQAGALFGESGVLERRSRAATATALTDTHLLVTAADTFLQAFGMNNERALALVKLLCQRLRNTTQRSARLTEAAALDPAHATIMLLADDPRLTTDYRMTSPVDVRYLPFQVGNRYGGETTPLGSNHTCCIAAHGNTELGAPHFEIIRRDGRVGVHDLGTEAGTTVNGKRLTRTSLDVFAPLRPGNNEVVAGRPGSPFRFRLQLLTG